MLNPKSRPALSIVLLGLFTSFSIVGCTTKKPYANYAQRAYLKDYSAQQSSVEDITLNQPTRDDLRVSAHDYRIDAWQKQPYESVERWVSRLEETLEGNNDLFVLGQEQYQTLCDQERQCVQQIDYFRHLNNKIEQIFYNQSSSSSVDPAISEDQKNILQKNIPFTIHLVAVGETLYSISKKYYGTGDRVRDIMLWNQGWIRNPKNLLAGLTLVLFFENSKYTKSSNTVTNYIHTIQKDLQSESDS